MIAERIIYIAIFITEALSTWLYFDYIYARKKGRAYLFASFTLGYSLLYIISLFDSIIFNAASFFIINAAVLKMNYSCRLRSSILHSAFLSVMMGTSELIINLFITYITSDYSAFIYSISAFVPLIVFSKVLYFLITVVAARLFKPHKESGNEPTQILLLCAMPTVSSIILITYVYIGLEGQLSEMTEVMVQISAVLLLLVNLVVLFVYNRIQAIDREYAALQMSQMRDQADASYYKMLQAQYDAQRILIHDIKKHCGVIDLMAANGESGRIREYIAELETLPEFKGKARLCDEPILNMILLRYMEYSAANEISFSSDVRADSVSFMDAASITALFGNLLSNAVEAAESSRRKMVDISVIKNYQQKNVLVSVINSCDLPPIKDANGNFKTRKDDAASHGYGTKSIARIVNKYNGISSTYYDAEAKEFHSLIRFPIE